MLSIFLVLSLVGAKSGGGLPALAIPKKAANNAKLGTIVINTSTQGAKIFLDDKPAGSAPATLKNVVAGEHRIKMRRLGYLMSEETVVVEAGKTVELQLDLLPYAGILNVKAQQKGAQVFVDGKGVGVVPFEGEISIGRRAVEVKKDGFQTYREVFQVGAGETYRIDVTLQKGSGEQTADVPLVAVIPKKKKAPVEEDPTGDIPLEAPQTLTPKLNPPIVGTSTTNVDPIVSPNIWYKQWWVWTIVGGVVIAGLSVGLGVGLNPQQRGPDYAFQKWSVGARENGPLSR